MKSRNKLIRQFENETDYSVCVWEMVKSGNYAVTTYDRVSRNHFDAAYFAHLDWAIKTAEKRNKEYEI